MEFGDAGPKSLLSRTAWSWKLIFTLLFLMKVGLVSSEAEDYGRSEEELDGTWGGIPANSLLKRHLGSLAALSRSRSLQGPESPFRLSGSKKSGFRPPLLRGFYAQRNLRANDEDESGKEQETFYDQPLTLYNAEEGADRWRTLKQKRFIGSLARGGWFPREFRGFVAEPQWDKRHVGAVARLGWMPHSKFGTRGNTEWNYKRSLASLRKNQIWIPKEEQETSN